MMTEGMAAVPSPSSFPLAPVVVVGEETSRPVDGKQQDDVTTSSPPCVGDSEGPATTTNIAKPMNDQDLHLGDSQISKRLIEQRDLLLGDGQIGGAGTQISKPLIEQQDLLLGDGQIGNDDGDGVVGDGASVSVVVVGGGGGCEGKTWMKQAVAAVRARKDGGEQGKAGGGQKRGRDVVKSIEENVVDTNSEHNDKTPDSKRRKDTIEQHQSEGRESGDSKRRKDTIEHQSEGRQSGVENVDTNREHNNNKQPDVECESGLETTSASPVRVQGSLCYHMPSLFTPIKEDVKSKVEVESPDVITTTTTTTTTSVNTTLATAITTTTPNTTNPSPSSSPNSSSTNPSPTPSPTTNTSPTNNPMSLDTEDCAKVNIGETSTQLQQNSPENRSLNSPEITVNSPEISVNSPGITVNSPGIPSNSASRPLPLRSPKKLSELCEGRHYKRGRTGVGKEAHMGSGSSSSSGNGDVQQSGNNINTNTTTTTNTKTANTTTNTTNIDVPISDTTTITNTQTTNTTTNTNTNTQALNTTSNTTTNTNTNTQATNTSMSPVISLNTPYSDRGKRNVIDDDEESNDGGDGDECEDDSDASVDVVTGSELPVTCMSPSHQQPQQQQQQQLPQQPHQQQQQLPHQPQPKQQQLPQQPQPQQQQQPGTSSCTKGTSSNSSSNSNSSITLVTSVYQSPIFSSRVDSNTAGPLSSSPAGPLSSSPAGRLSSSPAAPRPLRRISPAKKASPMKQVSPILRKYRKYSPKKRQLKTKLAPILPKVSFSQRLHQTSPSSSHRKLAPKPNKCPSTTHQPSSNNSTVRRKSHSNTNTAAAATTITTPR
ncbi:hypothetical protein Pmani_010991 [Petrolisthes manimaculis]|uniref:Uncharacterized protein n=1 Tax=Petrolisthes manimaculis TaxID=1843537 RepID=A0AAE1Q0F9_9EUCA|nr:hypothetical protein Pmani_010991 [Petrolisthes manimaculis]